MSLFNLIDHESDQDFEQENTSSDEPDPEIQVKIKKNIIQTTENIANEQRLR